MSRIADPRIPLAEAAAVDGSVVFLEAGKEPGEALVPGARRVVLADFGGEERADSGRLPLPEHAAFTAWLGGLGIGPDTAVVVVPATPRDLLVAARAWVTLRWAGVRTVRVLLAETGERLAAQGFRAPHRAGAAADFAIDPSVTADAEAVAARPAETLLVDARPAEAYGGAGEHIDGAVNVPSAAITEEGRLAEPDALRTAYAGALGAGFAEQPVIAYCGSGVAASVAALALTTIDVPAAVYIGSWSEWSKRHAPA